MSDNDTPYDNEARGRALTELAAATARHAPYDGQCGLVVVFLDRATGDVGWASTLPAADTTQALESVLAARARYPAGTVQ